VNPIRFGIIGSGYMAKMHSLALRNIGSYLPELPTIQMIRMADIVPGAARAGAERWGWGDATDDPTEVTDADDIDVVIVITPNNSHADYAINAFAHGKHVFCEKPLASTVFDAERMEKAATESGKVNIVNFSYRTWPGVEFAKNLIAEGELGELLHFEGHFFQDYACDRDLPFSWRFDRHVSGGGAFADIGSHITDIACALMGPVARVTARSKRLYETRPSINGHLVEVDDLTVSLMEFTSGAVGSVHASWAATGHKSDLGFTVIGTKGSVTFSWERSNELHFFSSKDPVNVGGFRRIILGGIHPEAAPFWYAQGQGLGYGEAFVITARRAIDAVIQNDCTRGPNFSEALHVVHVVDAVYRSAELAGWTDVPPTAAYTTAR
jgi:predicted dehydrogenase